MAKRSPYETGELSDSIFLILLATLEPAHGYRIMQGIRESTQGTVEIGPAKGPEGEGRIRYAATDEGRAVLRRDFERRRRLLALAEGLLGREDDGAGAGVGEEGHGEDDL